MGAREKLIESGKLVEFDFRAPALHIRKGDRESMNKDDDETVNENLVIPRAVVMVMAEVVTAAFAPDPRTGQQGGLGRKDGKIWAAWQELFGDEAELKGLVQVPLGQIEWLKKHVANDEVKIRPGFAQWREALADYLEQLCEQVRAKPAEEEAKAPAEPAAA
jgi:hypothetical protein